MRILYVLHQFFPDFHSGTEQFVLALARQGRAQGDDLRVFTVDPDFRRTEPAGVLDEYEVHGVPVYRYRFDRATIHNWVLREYENPEVGPPFAQVLDEFCPEAVHFFHFRWVGIERLEEARARGVPAFVHLMDFWFGCPNFLMLRPDQSLCDGPFDAGLSCFDCLHHHHVEALRQPELRTELARRAAAGSRAENEAGDLPAGQAMQQRHRQLAAALGRADGVFAPSHTVAEVLRGAGAQAEHTHHLPYGVDRALFADPPSPGDGPVQFGFLGTFAPHKGVHVLLEAFRQLPGDARLRLHGRFGDYPEYDEQLRVLAGDDPRIEFAGPFDHDQVREVLGSLHAVVVPSLWRENTPFVCLEARVAGVAVLASDLSGMAEAVPAGRGLLFRCGDPEDLSGCLDTFRSRWQDGSFPRQTDPAVADISSQYTTLRSHYQRGR